PLFGCAQLTGTAGSTWHGKWGWKAEDFFDDSRVIAVGKAIEANDIAEIDRVVGAGADANTKDKNNKTPLLWTIPDNKLKRFKRLLEQGADPNVVIKSGFNSHGGLSPGDSVTHMACKTAFPRLFRGGIRPRRRPEPH